jgi:cell division protein ZapA (FtsZ GTPase activity inhibitor)
MSNSSPTVMLEVTIGGRSYRFASPTDQVNRLKSLSARVDALINDMKQADPNTDRDRHLILACLTMASDLADAQQRLDDQAAAVTNFNRGLAERLESLLNNTPPINAA